MRGRLFSALLTLLLGLGGPCLALAASPATPAHEGATMQQDLSAMQQFNRLHDNETGLLKVKQKTQHRILFWMGLGLVLFLFMTAGFGLAMVFGGRQVFVWHMLCAGATITLALAHAVTSIIWFYPY